MTKRVKFTYITRSICPKTQIHYLDAISEDGEHYMAQMSHKIEEWICFTHPWKKSPQQPIQND